MSTNQEKITQPNFDNDEISLKELILKIKEWFTFLKSKWKTIFLAGIIGGLIGLTIAWFEKPTYKATLTFAMEEDKGGGAGLSGALGLASSFGIDLGGAGGGGAFAASNLAALMKSHLIIQKVLLDKYEINGKIKTLADYFIEINGFREKWSKIKNLEGIHFPPQIEINNLNRTQDSILLFFHDELTKKENLDISQKDKKVTILTIEVNSENELFSKLFCEAVANKTSEFYIQTKSKKARINTDVLQKQVDSIKQVLNSNITSVAVQTDNIFNLNPTLNIKGTKSKKSQIDVSANTEIFKQLVIQLELSKITLRKETPLIQFIDKPTFPLKKEKHGKIFTLIIGGFIGIFLTVLSFSIKLLLNRLLIN